MVNQARSPPNSPRSSPREFTTHWFGNFADPRRRAKRSSDCIFPFPVRIWRAFGAQSKNDEILPFNNHHSSIINRESTPARDWRLLNTDC
ncbi:MAG: hypothetical protein RIC55_26940 [Pirellulaceae bacterium]